MFLRAGNRIITWWTKSVLGRRHTAANVEDDIPTRRPDYCLPNSHSAFRQMTAENITFASINAYKKKKNKTKREGIMNKVLEEAIPGATRAVIVKTWHTSRSDKINHCTVDYHCNVEYTIRRHIYKDKAEKK